MREDADFLRVAKERALEGYKKAAVRRKTGSPEDARNFDAIYESRCVSAATRGGGRGGI
jgi:hypothetical protein